METCPACSYASSEDDFILIFGPFYTFLEKDESYTDIVPITLCACPKCGCVKKSTDK